MRNSLLAVVAAVLVSALGCRSTEPPRAAGYQTMPVDSERSTDAARRAGEAGLKSLKTGDLTAAETSLKEALAADNLFGPAHNNLGAVYLARKNYHLAAWEFHYAAKLMPERVEPLANLGLVYETVGRFDDAAQSYEDALKVDPDAIEVIGSLARVLVRRNQRDDRTRELLTRITLEDARPDWSAWAREQLALMGAPRAHDDSAPSVQAPRTTQRGGSR